MEQTGSFAGFFGFDGSVELTKFPSCWSVSLEREKVQYLGSRQVDGYLAWPIEPTRTFPRTYIEWY